MRKTSNFFMEYMSDALKGKFGGPYQSREHGVKWYVYMYPANRTYFIFEVDKLIEALDPIIKKLTPVEINNRSWVTLGFKIPRELLKHVYIERKFIDGV